MNQILFPEKIENYIKSDKKTLKLLKLQFLIVIINLTIFIVYFLISYYTSKDIYDFSSTIIDSYDISRLYSIAEPNSTISLPNGITTSVIGIIEINELGIKYPVLSDISTELLNISPCKFYGPDINQPGNLCIAGHNFDNNTFFSNLNKLNIYSQIILTDLKNNSIIYEVFDKFETNANDTSSLIQNIDEKKELTLITCNNLNGNRLIIKAKEKDV